LARYRPLEPDGAVEYIERLTAPGDLVVDLFCQGPTFLHAALQAGRRTVGVSVNPLSLLVAELGLEPLPAPDVLSAAFTRLADSPKGHQPLSRHANSLYHTRCPTCGGGCTAEWFAWDREGGYPYVKAARCPRCQDAQEGPTDEADIAAARHLERGGLAYHYALNRAAPPGHPARERAAELVALYTPRNLSVLMDVALRLEGLNLERATRLALYGLLLTAFDRGSSLDPHGEARPRPRVLRPPARFVERNVWLLLEDGLAHLLARLAEGGSPFPRAADLPALLADRTPAYFLAPAAAREVGRLLPPRSASLILADPTRPDGVFWALCALWAGWLWDTPQAHAMRPFLRRRRFNWEWHQEALQTALTAAVPLLTPQGHLVTLFVEPEGELFESVCLAAAGAGYELLGWGAAAEVGYRLVWRHPSAGRSPALPTPALPPPQAAADLAQACLRRRGEPTSWMMLHAAVYAGLPARRDAPAAGEERSPAKPPSLLGAVSDAVDQGIARLGLARVEDDLDLYWLPGLDAASLSAPLADRVEEMVWQQLVSHPAEMAGERVLAVYAALDGPLTPDLALVLLCLDSYGVLAQGTWRLREEDEPQRRQQEIAALRQDLLALGRRLGFDVEQGRGWDVRWQENGQDAYLFTLSVAAVLGCTLIAGPPVPPTARPCLVFPGGRAELLLHKLRRDPRAARRAEEQSWQFIKFRHLRRLIAEGLDRQLFEAVLGLDPIVAREGVQIPLILGGKS